jgi:Bacteriophage translational regulator
MDDLFNGLGVRIELPAKQDVPDSKERYKDAFHVVRETLTRIGIASRKTKTLYQTAHILHKRGQYAILHFKELFKLDGKPSDITDEDLHRRNLITKLLNEWGLVRVVVAIGQTAPLSQIKIVSFQEKAKWSLVPKYSIGIL